MNTAELIYQHSQQLPENLRIEALDFIDFLKSRYAINDEAINTKNKISELENAFAPYRCSFKDFSFNRDDANER